MTIQFTIYGQIYSMKNSKILTSRWGKPHSIKNPKAIIFERDFALQLPVDCKKNLTCDVAVTCYVWYPNHRQDLDVSIVHDLLQSCGVIQNDRQIIEQHNYKSYDKESPRVVVIVEKR